MDSPETQSTLETRHTMMEKHTQHRKPLKSEMTPGKIRIYDADLQFLCDD